MSLVNLNPATIPLRKPRAKRSRAYSIVVDAAAVTAAFFLCGAYIAVCVVAALRKDRR